MFSKGGHFGSAILDFLIFPKPPKSAKIDQKLGLNSNQNDQFKGKKYVKKEPDRES